MVMRSTMSAKNFEILEMIAKGGMAEVYRAQTRGFDGFAREVCVKKILPHLTADPQFVAMFVNEAKLAASLDFANIVQVHDLCISPEDEYFIVMEYVHGRDLSDVIRVAQQSGREIPSEFAVYVARETAKGLDYAHHKRDPSGALLSIVHRDVSPQNVLVSFNGQVKLTDFGIAKASATMTSNTAVGILKGKYGYMSPEQARGEPLDPRSDIFNVGIVLYELLVGERCFAGASDFSTLNLMREAMVTPPSQINRAIPKELEAIVMKALQRRPQDRFPDALALEAALGDYARASGREARDQDAAHFMRELFQAPPDQPPKTTSVLALSSLVGPSAAQPGPSARSGTEPGASPGAVGGLAAASAAELAAAWISAAKPTVNARPPVSRSPAPLPPEPRAAPPRRLLGRAALLLAVAGLMGASFGVARARLLPGTSDPGFRAAELAGRHPGHEPRAARVTVYIDSEPRGAAVWLDQVRLAETTPLSVERSRDDQIHTLEVGLPELAGRTARSTFRYEAGPLTVLRPSVHP
jgi:serine/threonine-protein kinase